MSCDCLAKDFDKIEHESLDLLVADLLCRGPVCWVLDHQITGKQAARKQIRLKRGKHLILNSEHELSLFNLSQVPLETEGCQELQVKTVKCLEQLWGDLIGVLNLFSERQEEVCLKPLYTVGVRVDHLKEQFERVFEFCDAKWVFAHQSVNLSQIDLNLELLLLLA